MYTYLKERSYYEDLYDKLTVESGRRNIVYFNSFRDEFVSKLPKGEAIDNTGNALLINCGYMTLIGDDLCRRYEERDQKVSDWMARDAALDEQIASARLAEEPLCRHCGRQGLRITDKQLMHRGDDHEYDDPQEVLFMLTCPACDKISAYWEDGTLWKVKPTLCPKCSTELTYTSKSTKKLVATTYSCPSCAHTYKEKLDLTTTVEEPDPTFATDRAHYCLQDKEFREHLFEIRRGIRLFAELGQEMQEKEDNKAVYDAIKELKKPKIAELIPLLSEPLQKAGYIEFHLDTPDMGREVFVAFSCLDSKSDRDDAHSRKELKKLVETALKPTNWRLMSDGISYRLGYLSGRLRAYESEDELKKLIEKTNHS